MALWHRIGIVTLANHADSVTALLLPKPIYIYILRIFSTTQVAACIGQDITEEEEGRCKTWKTNPVKRTVR